MECLQNYIGIRGECDSAILWLDDLPGINIEKASNITNGIELRPIDLVNKCFRQAQGEVINDILGKIALQYNEILDDSQFTYAGNYQWYGEVNEDIKLKLWNRLNDKFVNLHVSGFEIVTDRAINDVDFIIADGYDNTTTLTVDLVKGLNQIDLDYLTKSEYVSISVNLSNFRIGIKDITNIWFSNGSCRPCERSNATGIRCHELAIYRDDVLTYSNIGFNLTVRCEADMCEILKYLAPSISNSLLYKTGIHYLLEAKLSGRLNAYLRNTIEDIEQILTLWQGGYDNVNDVKVYSIYSQKVKQDAAKVENQLRKLNPMIFSYTGSTIDNSLPS